MKITDCNISREAQIALHRIGVYTTDGFKDEHIMECLDNKGLRFEPPVIRKGIENLINKIHEGVSSDLLYAKGNDIDIDIGNMYPKNFYAYLVNEFMIRESPYLDRKPFSTFKGEYAYTDTVTAKALANVNELVTVNNNILSDEERFILYKRFKLLYTLKDISELYSINEDVLSDKIYDCGCKIAKKLCFIFGSDRLEGMGVSDKTLKVLNKLGIVTREELWDKNLANLLVTVPDLNTDVLDEIAEFLRTTSRGLKVIDFTGKYSELDYATNALAYAKERFKSIAKGYPFSDESKQDELCSIIRCCTAKDSDVIPDRSKRVFFMRFGRFKTEKEIAKKEGISQNYTHVLIMKTIQLMVQKIIVLYTNDDSILKLKVSDAVKADMMKKGICTIPEDSIFTLDLDIDTFDNLYFKGICTKTDYFDKLIKFKEAKKLVKQFGFLDGLNLDTDNLDFSHKLSVYGLPVKSCNVLLKAGIKSGDDLINISEDEIFNVLGLNIKRLPAVLALRSKLLKIKEEVGKCLY